MIKGRVVYADSDKVWLARGASLLVSDDQGVTWQPYTQLSPGLVGSIAASTRLARRLLRSGVHHFIPGDTDVVCLNRHLFYRSGTTSNFSEVSRLQGSRPLAMATDGKLVCYGEYRKNSERSTVSVWGDVDGTGNWLSLTQFSGVRHIHGIYFDPYESKFWITTGDDDEETGIWTTEDRFSTVVKVAGGGQQLRAVQLLFTRDYVYFGSDTPVAANHLYRMERRNRSVERLQAVGSSVFFGCKVGDALFFSTAIEPSPINRTDAVELWCSLDGQRWTLLQTFAKDQWPVRYFQYGQILFPAGPGDGKNLWFTPFAVRGDQHTFKVSLSEIVQQQSATVSATSMLVQE